MPLSKSRNDNRYTSLGLKIVGDFGATIAIPVVIFVIIGQKLDERWLTTPRYTIIAFILAALVSGTSLYKKAKWYGQQFHNLNAETDARKELTKEISENVSSPKSNLEK